MQSQNKGGGAAILFTLYAISLSKSHHDLLIKRLQRQFQWVAEGLFYIWSCNIVVVLVNQAPGFVNYVHTKNCHFVDILWRLKSELSKGDNHLRKIVLLPLFRPAQLVPRGALQIRFKRHILRLE